jgi:hypothetical protein
MIDFPRDPRISDELKRYLEWHKLSYNWSPLESLICFQCKKEVPLIAVYRCYECDMPFHKNCLIEHCKENKETIK